MLKFEKKLIEWINAHMLSIAMFFTIFAAIWIRVTSRNYIGIDFHYSLYQIPGNCNPWLHRSLATLLMTFPDHAIALFKILAYVGDFGVAFFTLLMLRKSNLPFVSLRNFFTSTACLLSPVVLMYGAGGMRIDSVCMCLLLMGIFLYQTKARLLPAVPLMVLAAFIQTTYWPVIIAVMIFILRKQLKEEALRKDAFISLAVLLFFLVFSIFFENLAGGEGYFWGKVFIIDSLTETSYAGPEKWLSAMFNKYGYTLTTGTLIASLRFRKLRIPALIIQILILFIVGWQMTSHLAI